MWGIPKQLADFTFEQRLTAETIASAEESPRTAPRLPARLTAARPRLHLAVTNLRMRFGAP